MLIGMELLEEIIATCLATCAIEKTCPVSLMLVAISGSAKSAIIRRFVGDHIHKTDSITSAGLWDLVQRDTNNSKRFILIPDLNPTLSRKPSTVVATVSNLLTLTFDGCVRVDDGRGEKALNHEPMGFISAMTPEVYSFQARRWFALGLRRRIIPLFYTYAPATIIKLQTAVTAGKINTKEQDFIKVNPPKKTCNPAIPNKEAQVLAMLSERFAACLGKDRAKVRVADERVSKWIQENVLPIAPHATLRALARAHAIIKSRGSVNQTDIDFVGEFLSFCDPQTPRQI